ncbi:MAG: response regulator transcription factor [Chloroflexota bacterium]
MSGSRVLIVDDMARVRRDLRTVLALTGLVDIVGEAGNGEEAVRQAGALRPDVVLMDLEMPVLDGFAATRRIKANHPAMRVVALTIHSYPSARIRAFQAGVDDFIEKGASLEKIIQAIQLKGENS